MKFLSSLLLALSISLPSAFAEVTDSGCEHPFIDILNHWAEESVCFLYNEQIIEGHSDRNFLPDNKVTRAEFLKISLRTVGYVVTSMPDYSFTDVYAGDWYYQYVTFAKYKGFISGYSDGSFHPNEPISRAEAVVLIIKIAEIIDYDISETTTAFSDVDSTDWFATAVAAALKYKIIEGYGDGTFRPYNSLTRAESSVIAENVWNNLY